MKILYSQIKEFIPALKAEPREIGDILTLTGSMMDGFKKIKYRGKPDYLLSFEIRQNRPDCLSAIGLAREIAAFYGLSIKPPKAPKIFGGNDKLDIKNEAGDYVKKISAVRIKNLENGKSPQWLKELLTFYDINPINLLVDLSNYVMVVTGYPSHLLDTKKMTGSLFWSKNRNFKKITTLDDSLINLEGGELIVRDNKNILALAGIVGGKTAEINFGTKSIIAEMAIYDGSIIRKNSRNLKVITEASNRLEKNLSPDCSKEAFLWLISLILENCGGKVDSEIFEYYPKKQILPKIKFQPTLPGIFAGIEIPSKKVIKILKNLNFQIKGGGKNIIVSPPAFRTDISIPEDLAEEAIRMAGFDKIPADEIPRQEVVKNITPKNIYLAEKIRDILSNFGFDEILSWPLIKRGENSATNYSEWGIVSTQNSVNENYPDLRQSMAPGLINQFSEYSKKNIEYINIFEIGKVFGKKGNIYQEQESLGILMSSNQKDFANFQKTVENLLMLIGFKEITYSESKIKPKIANLHSCWDINIQGRMVGIIYKLKPQRPNQNTYFSEINLAELANFLDKIKNVPVVELTQKLIVLDANAEISKEDSIADFLAKVRKKINQKNLFGLAIVDKFVKKEKIKYTIRVVYQELSDKEAKKIHLAAFGLKKY